MPEIFRSIRRSATAAATVAVLLVSSTMAQQVGEPKTMPEHLKTIHVHGFYGPFGTPYIPPEMVSQREFKENPKFAVDDFIFPSMYFVVSAKPNIQIEKDPKTKPSGFIDYEFSKVGRELEWMRVTIKLEPVPCTEGDYKPTLADLKSDPTSARALALIPELTDEEMETSKPVTLAKMGSEMAAKVTPMIPSLKTEVDALSSATTILFKNLFPSRVVAKSYAFLDGHLDFGWYWSQRKNEAKPESLLGLRRGIALLQVKKGVKALKARYTVVAKWDGDPNDFVDDEYADADTIPYNNSDTQQILFRLPDSNCKKAKPQSFYERLDYEFLRNLDEFPMVVPKEVVCRIMQKDKPGCDAWKPENIDWLRTFQSEKGLVILREDLKKLFGLK